MFLLYRYCFVAQIYKFCTGIHIMYSWLLTSHTTLLSKTELECDYTEIIMNIFISRCSCIHFSQRYIKCL